MLFSLPFWFPSSVCHIFLLSSSSNSIFCFWNSSSFSLSRSSLSCNANFSLWHLSKASIAVRQLLRLVITGVWATFFSVKVNVWNKIRHMQPVCYGRAILSHKHNLFCFLLLLLWVCNASTSSSSSSWQSSMLPSSDDFMEGVEDFSELDGVSRFTSNCFLSDCIDQDQETA